MSVKLSGAEFKSFYADPGIWAPEGQVYHDDLLLRVDGEVFIGEMNTGKCIDGEVADIPDDALVAVECGIIYWPGEDGREERQEFKAVLRRWMKKQSQVKLLVQATRENRDAVESAIRAAGGRVVSG